ncbi:hypothetical protein AB0P21_18260 [Kribbella sp. NPDC056861]|uniref:hypothetical protein n=1 Tax=Kribbella sp. NPDC056861 TaxID=3154857 RepID=UPI003439262C
MAASNTATLTTPAPVDVPAVPTVGAFYRTTAQLRALWLKHRGIAEVALAAALLLLAAVTFIAAR